jgi:hypothetical protein
MRKILAVVALLIAAAVFLVSTAPGNQVLSAFGVAAPDCIQARWLAAVGFQVPQCQCGTCSSPIPPPPPH